MFWLSYFVGEFMPGLGDFRIICTSLDYSTKGACVGVKELYWYRGVVN